LLLAVLLNSCNKSNVSQGAKNPTERISINSGLRFFKYESSTDADELMNDVRPDVSEDTDDRTTDPRSTDAEKVESSQKTLESWIMPTGNSSIKDPGKHFMRPKVNTGSNFPYVQSDFEDTYWEYVDLPDGWAIVGPFDLFIGTIILASDIFVLIS
jgi:beta-galactosidase